MNALAIRIGAALIVAVALTAPGRQRSGRPVHVHDHLVDRV